MTLFLLTDARGFYLSRWEGLVGLANEAFTTVWVHSVYMLASTIQHLGRVFLFPCRVEQQPNEAFANVGAFGKCMFARTA